MYIPANRNRRSNGLYIRFYGQCSASADKTETTITSLDDISVNPHSYLPLDIPSQAHIIASSLALADIYIASPHPTIHPDRPFSKSELGLAAEPLLLWPCLLFVAFQSTAPRLWPTCIRHKCISSLAPRLQT